MKHTTLYIVATLLILLGCSKSEITPPGNNEDANLVNTTTIPGSTMKKMEGYL